MKFFDKLLTIANNLASDYYRLSDKSENREITPDKKRRQSTGFLNENSRQQSLKSSQGTSDFSGSSYNGPGNVDHEKRNSNMSQRNF